MKRGRTWGLLQSEGFPGLTPERRPEWIKRNQRRESFQVEGAASGPAETRGQNEVPSSDLMQHLPLAVVASAFATPVTDPAAA